MKRRGGRRRFLLRRNGTFHPECGCITRPSSSLIMAKSFTCNTRSQAGNMILGVLFLGCGLLLVATPCFALVGTVFGSVTAPKDGHDLLGTLCALAVCLAMAVATLALGVLCLHATLLPKTLEITDEGIELRWFKKR